MGDQLSVQPHPVVRLDIRADHVLVNGQVVHAEVGDQPTPDALRQAGVQVAANTVAAELGRPVRAVASDEYGDTEIVIYPNGSCEPVAPPRPPVFATLRRRLAATYLALRGRISRRLKDRRTAGVLGTALVAALLVMLGWAVVAPADSQQESRSPSDDQSAERSPRTVQVAQPTRFELRPAKVRAKADGAVRTLRLKITTTRGIHVRVDARVGGDRRVKKVWVAGTKTVSFQGLRPGRLDYRITSPEALKPVKGSATVAAPAPVVPVEEPTAVPSPSRPSTSSPAPTPKTNPKRKTNPKPNPKTKPKDPTEPTGPIDPDDL